jgi:enoyl-CoA hydratase/carnithine racemase
MLADGAQDDTSDSRALFGDAFDGADFKEGYRAFLEKRPPQFE